MLTVPHLKPGQTPYDPSIAAIISIDPNSTQTSPPPTKTPDITSILDHAIVKDAVTTLHQEDDTHFATLQEYTALQIHTLKSDHQNYLTNQKNKFLNLFSSSQLKQLFLTATQPYFSWSAHRAEILYNTKITTYHAEVIERQNQELLDRAIQPENAFDDTLQTTYRDMILFNLENLLDDAPPKERKAHLDEASHIFYRKVIEKRLELDPNQLDPILTSPAVKRVLTPKEINHYRKTAHNSLQRESWKQLAESWVNDDLTSSTVKQNITSHTSNNEDRKTLHDIYTHFQYNKHRKQCLTLILNAINVWNRILENGVKPESIPHWVTRVNPPLRDYLLTEITRYNNNGGLPGDIDYVHILDFIENFTLHQAMATLSNESKLYKFIERAGDIQSDVFGIIQRLLTASLEDSDDKWITQHILAKQVITNHLGEQPDSQRINTIIKRFSSILQTRITNHDGKHPDELEIQTILTELLSYEDMTKTKTSSINQTE